MVVETLALMTQKGHAVKEEAMKLIKCLKTQDATQQRLLRENRGTDYSHLQELQDMDRAFQSVEKAAAAAAAGYFEDGSIVSLLKAMKTFLSFSGTNELPIFCRMHLNYA